MQLSVLVAAVPCRAVKYWHDLQAFLFSPFYCNLKLKSWVSTIGESVCVYRVYLLFINIHKSMHIFQKNMLCLYVKYIDT